MGAFSKINETKVFGGGQYFEPGHYRVKIKDTKMVDSSQTPGKQFVVIETEVLESDCEKIPAGSERSQVIPLGEQMSLSNVKAFVAAASGVEPLDDDINVKVEKFWTEVLGESTNFEQICDLIFESGQNPLGDEIMDLECTEIITKKNKQPFTKHHWQPRVVDGGAAEAVA